MLRSIAFFCACLMAFTLTSTRADSQDLEGAPDLSAWNGLYQLSKPESLRGDEWKVRVKAHKNGTQVSIDYGHQGEMNYIHFLVTPKGKAYTAKSIKNLDVKQNRVKARWSKMVLTATRKGRKNQAYNTETESLQILFTRPGRIRIIEYVDNCAIHLGDMGCPVEGLRKKPYLIEIMRLPEA